MEPERQVQPSFRKTELLQLLSVFWLVLLAGRWVFQLPDRTELGARSLLLKVERLHLDPGGFAPMRLAGAWRLTGADARVGGVSALAVDRERLLALTDSGVMIRFTKPPSAALAAVVRELPGGPGDPRFKSRRDSEALAPDPSRRGWWVAFENRNELWLYDRDFRRPLERVAFRRQRWPRNRGIEAVAAADGALLLVPERGDRVVELRGRAARTYAIAAPAGRISDAVRLPDGRLLVVNRSLTPLGFANTLAWLERSDGAYRQVRRVELRLSSFDNVEAIAAEPLLGGGTRLWLMTDDNFQRPLRTLLLALDLPARSGG